MMSGIMQLRRAWRTVPRFTRGKHDATTIERFTASTWSVNELLSTYPAPTLQPATLTRLHKVSALTPAPEDSAEFSKLKFEVEELVRLVEAVKLVDASHASSDGRILEAERGLPMQPEEASNLSEKSAQNGTRLLQHASRTAGSFYFVEGGGSGKSDNDA